MSGKINELSGAYGILENIPIKINVISGDAIFCQKGLCSRIVDEDGDFIFVVKGNQKVLFSGIQKIFPLGAEYFERCTTQSLDKAHGRFESRHIESVCHRFADWPEIRQILHIMRQREHRGH